MRDEVPRTQETQVPDSSAVDQRGLIEAFLQGEGRGIAEVDRWIDVVLRDDFFSLRGEWEDLRQEIRFRVFQNLSRGRFDGRSSLRTYVHRIARNTCIDSSRLAFRRRETRGEEERKAAAPASREPVVSGVIARDLLLKILDGLSDGDRLVVLLVLGERYSCSEAAQRLGVSRSAVKSRLSRCRDRLLRKLGRLLGAGGGPR